MWSPPRILSGDNILMGHRKEIEAELVVGQAGHVAVPFGSTRWTLWVKTFARQRRRQNERRLGANSHQGYIQTSGTATLPHWPFMC